MTYHAKTNWKFDDPVTEDDFNRIERGIKGAYEGLEEKGNEITEHEEKRNNPHNVNKGQVGLSNVDNVKQATKAEFDSHDSDKTRHITASERSSWNAKETPEGAQEKVDEHADLKNNPHNVTKSQVGLSNVTNHQQVKKSGDTVTGDLVIEKEVRVKEGLVINRPTNADDPRFKFIYNTSGDLELWAYNSNEEWELRAVLGGRNASKMSYGGNVVETTSGAQSKVNSHANKTDNPHSVTKGQVGLGSVQNYGVATQSEAETGASNSKYMTPQRTKQAIDKLTPEGISEQDVDKKIETHAERKNVHGLNASNLAIGSSASATDSGSTAVGRWADSIGPGSTAIGGNTETHRYATALGNGASSLGDSSIALGHDASAVALGSIALGSTVIANNNGEGILGGSKLSLTNKWIIPGSFTVSGTKNFEMPHPHPDKRETHRLRHSAVESPTAGDNLYRFEIEAKKDNETVEYELPDYFQYLNKDVDVWVNGVDHFGNAYGKVEGNTLKVTCEYEGKYKVLVIGTRNDEHQSVQDWGIKGVEREIGESWTGETYVFEVDEILSVEEIKGEEIQ